MFGLDMTLWNRVQYPSMKSVASSVRDTTYQTLVVGVGSFGIVSLASKIVAVLLNSSD
jgi:hypothetical protein